jgi:hypothetical protein
MRGSVIASMERAAAIAAAMNPSGRSTWSE